MERRSSRRDERNRDAIEMLDQSSSEKRRQLRRLGSERVPRKINRGADRAIIVRVIAGLLRWNGLRYLRSRTSDIDRRGGAMDAVNMDVSESQDELQR